MMTSQQIQYGGWPPFWKYVYCYNSAVDDLISTNFCVLMRILITRMNTGQKVKILQTQDGGRPPHWKWFYHYISSVDHPILTKLRVLMHILVPRMGTWQKYQHFQQNGGHPPYWKSFFWLHLGYIYFRLMQNLICISKIMLRQGYMTKITNFVNSFWWTAAITKMILSLYLSRGSSDFDEICCADARFNSENSHLTKNQNFAYSKSRTATIWNIVIWLHLSELLSG